MTATFAIFMSLCSDYTQLAYTHNYIFTFNFSGIIYAVKVRDFDANALANITKLGKTSSSKGGGYSLRFRPTTAQKQYLVSLGATQLCSKRYFEELVANSKYNRGEIAEMLVTEKLFGQTWVKDSVPFTKAGDVEADGIAWQHKHEGATFCSEKSLRNLSK